mmetsp:Transcript_39112/g.101239  ORF Transcript_39112/g.101239 Transcript_39112/m.101239 type:complete len:89 (+) Transcript_39112:4954-5220(+)
MWKSMDVQVHVMHRSHNCICHKMACDDFPHKLASVVAMLAAGIRKEEHMRVRTASAKLLQHKLHGICEMQKLSAVSPVYSTVTACPLQ